MKLVSRGKIVFSWNTRDQNVCILGRMGEIELTTINNFLFSCTYQFDLELKSQNTLEDYGKTVGGRKRSGTCITKALKNLRLQFFPVLIYVIWSLR